MNAPDDRAAVPAAPAHGVAGHLLAGAGVLAFAVTLATTLTGAAARYFGLPGFEWSFELAGIAFLWTTFLGVTYAELRDENVAFSLLADRCGPTGRRRLAALAAFALLVLSAFLLASGAAAMRRSGLVPTPLLRWPSAVASTPLLVFATAAFAIAAARLARLARRRRGPHEARP